MRRQTYGYLPRHRASPPLDCYQIILLGDRGTCVRTTCPDCYLKAHVQETNPRPLESQVQCPNHYATRPHTYHLTALFPGLPGWAGTRKVKPIWILLKQETVSGSGISWAICKSAPRSRQITMPTPHRSVFLQAGCPSCRPTNSLKALKAKPPGHNGEKYGIAYA